MSSVGVGGNENQEKLSSTKNGKTARDPIVVKTVGKQKREGRSW